MAGSAAKPLTAAEAAVASALIRPVLPSTALTAVPALAANAEVMDEFTCSACRADCRTAAGEVPVTSAVAA